VARLGRFGAKPETTQALVDLCREIHALPADVRGEALQTLGGDTLRAIKALDYEWILHGRPEQLAPPPPWRWWVMCGGRGGGKTRPAAEQVIDWAWDNPGARMAFIAKDAGSRNRNMVGGDSGVLRRSPPWFRPRLYKTDKRLVWPNDTVAELHTSEEPATLRGPNYHYAWVTELFHWNISKGEKEPRAWREGIKLSLRIGDNPQGIVDSSPRRTSFCADFLLGPERADGKRAVTQEEIESGEWRITHELVDEEKQKHSYVVVYRRWSSERNAPNLAPGLIAEWRNDLRGSALEEQELDGKIGVKVEGALWNQEALDAGRVYGIPSGVTITRTLVSLDPTRADAPTDEAGIIVGGLGSDGVAYVWDDYTLRASPKKYAERAVEALSLFSAEGIVLEKNRLEEKTRQTIRSVDPKGTVKWIEVQATDGKRARAEPVSALYESGKVRHVCDRRSPDKLQRLEAEMVSWDPRLRQASPNRLDALVWLIWALLLGEYRPPLISR
jgi:phage terminase large subunit-like protein